MKFKKLVAKNYRTVREGSAGFRLPPVFPHSKNTSTAAMFRRKR